ncbi:MAG: copper transporter [Actinobacteria bacterium]|nr:copper transporter [Actinomycetota bacterium]
MFDLRYHVASLAAVFVALLIGILVGVGLSGKVDDAEKNQLRREAAALERRLDAIGERQANSGRVDEATDEVVELGYPLLIEDRLRGRRVGLLFVGSPDRELESAVRATLEDAGGRGLTRMRALNVPIDPERLDGALAGRPALAGYRGPGRLRELGKLLAQEFVFGGDAPAWDALSPQLVVEQRGRARPRLQGIVVARNVGPQQGDTARFLAGVFEGLASTGTPAVGVETSTDEPSAVQAFERAELSSVDDIDLPAGRLALALLLAGGEPGHYGVKEADAVLPPFEQLAESG